MSAIWAKMMHYETEGAVAANNGKTREDCPYVQGVHPEQDLAWTHWVYGNENAQCEMVTRWREQNEEGYTTLYMSTGELDDYTRGLLEAERERWSAAEDCMRRERGWKPRENG